MPAVPLICLGNTLQSTLSEEPFNPEAPSKRRLR